MAAPAFLMAAGTMLNMYGGYTANMAQAEAEYKNAEFYRYQAQYAKLASLREANLATQKYAQIQSAQVSAAAKGGADVGSGSMVSTVAQTLADKTEELVAIERKGELDSKLATLRANQSAEQGNTLSSWQYNAMQMGGTVLTNYAKLI